MARLPTRAKLRRIPSAYGAIYGDTNGATWKAILRICILVHIWSYLGNYYGNSKIAVPRIYINGTLNIGCTGIPADRLGELYMEPLGNLHMELYMELLGNLYISPYMEPHMELLGKIFWESTYGATWESVY